MKEKDYIQKAKEHFGKLLEKQFARIEKMKAEEEFIDYSKLEQLVIGIVGGDGIGPYITEEARKIIEFLLADDIKAGKIVIKI